MIGVNGSTRERKQSEKGKEVLDERTVRRGVIPNVVLDDFNEAGYICEKCGWMTSKKGNDGLQAIRAHMKRHVRDRRAVTHAVLFRILIITVSALIAVAPEIDTEWSEWITGIAPLEQGHVVIDYRLVVSLSALTAIGVITTAIRVEITGRRVWFRKFRQARSTSDALVLGAAMTWWLKLDTDLLGPWLLVALIPWLLTLWTHPMVSLLQLQVKRREFQPGSFRRLMKSKSTWTDLLIRKQKRNLSLAIKDGRIVLGNLNARQRDSFNRLGLGSVRLDEKKRVQRLAKERRDQTTARKKQGRRDAN